MNTLSAVSILKNDNYKNKMAYTTTMKLTDDTRMKYILVQWYNHCREIPIHVDNTAKDLKTRCLLFLPPEARLLFHVCLNMNNGEQVKIKESDKFGNHLATCKYIELKQNSSTWDGLPVKMRIPVCNVLTSDSGYKLLEVYFDVENCCIPKGKSGKDILERLKSILGPCFKDVKVYIVGSSSALSKPIKQFYSVQGVQISMVGDTDSKKLNAADTKINNLIFKNSAGSCKQRRVVVLISGDKDFSSTLHILEHNFGIPTMLVHKSGSDPDLSLWSTVTCTYEDLCRNLPDPNFKTEKSCPEVNNANEEEGGNIGSPDMSQMNVNLKTSNNEADENCSLFHLGARLKGPLAKNVTLIFCNRTEKLQIKPWDTVGAVKGQVAFLLIIEEGSDFNNGFISCSVASKELYDDQNIFDHTSENTEIIFQIPSASVTQAWTFCGYDYSINFSPIPGKISEAVLLWDMRLCPIPDNRNGLHIVKRAADRFCYDYKIKNFYIFTDKENVPNTQKMFFFLMDSDICSETKLPSEMKSKLLQDSQIVKKIIVITGDDELIKFIDDLKTTHSNIILITNKQSTADTGAFTYEDLIKDLPDRLQEIVDFKKKIVVEGDLGKKDVRKELDLKVQQHRGIGSYKENFSYYLSTFQTESGAKNFKKVIDGNEIFSGCTLTAKFPEESGCLGKVEVIGNNVLSSQSTPDENAVPPAPDSIYHGGCNVIIKHDPSKSAGVSDDNENLTEGEPAAFFHNINDDSLRSKKMMDDSDSTCNDGLALLDLWGDSDDSPEKIDSDTKKTEFQSMPHVLQKVLSR
ncbi:unnamed protein product, partial [Lymnaea stagnalis]